MSPNLMSIAIISSDGKKTLINKLENKLEKLENLELEEMDIGNPFQGKYIGNIHRFNIQRHPDDEMENRVL